MLFDSDLVESSSVERCAIRNVAMKTRGALLALVALVLAAVLAPPPAIADACAEEVADDCCIPCGTGCFCCATVPRVVPTSSAAGAHPGLESGRVAPGRLAVPSTPSPRDILHVPRSATSPL
jgi:hypothetical protein